MSARNRLLLVPLVPLLVAAWVTPAAAAPADPCANAAALHVPGAELQRVSCETDLSATVLATKDLSDASDWEGLHSQKTVNPTGRVPASRSTATSPTTRRRTPPTAGTTTPSS